ncbi:MAG TPA: ATP-binding protein, partial [Treponemataceae bacterium]|nr:ATP-binding protein [Treponemataceae bacterium]
MELSGLPVDIENLLTHRRIESDRIEFKEGWNPNSIYRSICAFANDFDNIGGGYILIGVEEKNGAAVRPVKGLSASEIASIQKEMIGFNNLVRPTYAPRLSMERVDDKDLIALWIPGGPDRPYEVPESIKAKEKIFKYYIRRYANSIEAKGRDREELIGLASQHPFDDRANRNARIT